MAARRPCPFPPRHVSYHVRCVVSITSQASAPCPSQLRSCRCIFIHVGAMLFLFAARHDAPVRIGPISAVNLTRASSLPSPRRPLHPHHTTTTTTPTSSLALHPKASLPYHQHAIVHSTALSLSPRAIDASSQRYPSPCLHANAPPPKWRQTPLRTIPAHCGSCEICGSSPTSHSTSACLETQSRSARTWILRSPCHPHRHHHRADTCVDPGVGVPQAPTVGEAGPDWSGAAQARLVAQGSDVRCRPCHQTSLC